MDTHLELEYKAALTRQEYERLIKRFPRALEQVQTNEYFRYSDPSIRVASRIRTIGEERVLTFKIPQGEAKREINFTLDSDENGWDRPDVIGFLKQEHLSGRFEPIGQLMTRRLLVMENDGELCLDESRYLGMTDYELEYEVSGDEKRAYARFLEILALEAIVYRPSRTKFARFLERKGL